LTLTTPVLISFVSPPDVYSHSSARSSRLASTTSSTSTDLPAAHVDVTCGFSSIASIIPDDNSLLDLTIDTFGHSVSCSYSYWFCFLFIDCYYAAESFSSFSGYNCSSVVVENKESPGSIVSYSGIFLCESIHENMISNIFIKSIVDEPLLRWTGVGILLCK
jgi:hypothetical protein